MARQNPQAHAPAAASANRREGYPNNLASNFAASQDKARPNLLNRDGEMGRSKDGPDVNKKHDCP